MLHRAKRFWALWSLPLVLAAGGQAAGRTPTEQIRETIEQVSRAVSGSESESRAERRERLRGVLLPRFDFFEMAKQTLGKHWNAVPNREEFVAGFAEFLGNAYAGRIEAYKDRKVVFMAERVQEERAEVQTQIVAENGQPMSVDYRLHRVGGDWKIYDVVVEQISLVSNYRAQFSRILAHGSFDDLMKRLREKAPPEP